MKPSYAIVTPSYHVDFRCCEILSASIHRYVDSAIKHYIVIPRKDESLFSKLASSRTKFIFQDDIVPSWLKQTPFSKRYWFSWRTPPVRGWIRQQLIKLSACDFVEEDVIIFMDSDCFLIRHLDPSSIANAEGRIPLFRETMPPTVNLSDNAMWLKHAFKTLGLDPAANSSVNYVGQIMFWRRDVLQKLQKQIVADSIFSSWQQKLCFSYTLSEYTLYGVFVEHMILNESGHYLDETIRSKNYWGTTPLARKDLEKIKSEIEDHQIGVMISSKSNTPVDEIRSVFL